MSKKGLITSLVLGLLVTLSLSIYTLVSVLAPNKPNGPQVVHYYHSYRYSETIPEQTDTEVDLFSKYGEGVTLAFEKGEGVAEMPISYNEQTKKFDAVGVGEVTVTATLDKKGNQDVHHITVYAQGDGTSEESPWIVAQPEHFVELAEQFNSSNAELAPEYVELVGDIDLSEVENWQPIGTFAHPYTGNIIGNGVTISGVNITLTRENYQDFICPANESGTLSAFVDLGLFGATKGARIENVNVEDVNITVESGVYEEITNAANYPDGMLSCNVFARLTAGSLVGYAEDTTIVGGEEVKSHVDAVLHAYGYTNASYMNGVGGLVGAARRTRVSNYSVNARVYALNKDIKNVWLGGVVGCIDSQLKDSSNGNSYVEATAKSVIDNVEVGFTVDVYYDVNGEVGGVAGRAVSVDIKNSVVKSFKVNDPTIRTEIVPDNASTILAGVVGRFASYIDTQNNDLTTAMLSSARDITVLNVDITMRGGNVAGAFGVVGDNKNKVADKINIVNVTVSGKINANIAAGFARQINEGVTVSYDHEFDGNVVDIRLINGEELSGFASICSGLIKGYEGEAKTSVKVVATGIGTEPRTFLPSSIYNLREGTYVAGLVAKLEQDETSVIPEISNFKVNVTATNSVNYAGVAQSVAGALISCVDVDATFTSAYISKGNYSSTYMVSGVANKVQAGTTIENCVVNVNVNQVVRANELYGAAYVGGLVARYFGDSAEAGLTLTGNTLTGKMYFNSLWDQYSIYFDNARYDLFVAGGLIGSMSNPYDAEFKKPEWWNETEEEANERPDPADQVVHGTWDPKYYDAIKAIDFSHTKIEDNHIGVLVTEEREVATNPENPEETTIQTVVVERIPFAITLDVAQEEQGQYGYLTRAIGATVGAVYTTADRSGNNLDLSKNEINRFVVDVYELAFTFAKQVAGSQEVKRLSVVNDQDKVTYGVSYVFNLENQTPADNITDVANAFDDAEGTPAAERKIDVTLRQ